MQRKESYIYTGKIDRKILMASLLLTLIGAVGMYAPGYEWNNYNFSSQCMQMVIGLLLLYFVSKINYQYSQKIGKYGVALVVFILCIAYIFFDTYFYDPGWIEINGIELYIPYLLLASGCLCLAEIADFRRMSDINFMFYLYLIAAVIGFTISESWKYLLVFFLVTAGVFFLKFPRSIIGFIAGGIVAVSALILKSRDSILQSERLAAWLNPFEGLDNFSLETSNALYMISSGGLFGQGIGGNTGLLWINPRGIFLVSKIIKDLGWIGALLLIVVFAFFFWKGIEAIMKAPDKKAFYLGASILLVFMIRFMINFMVNLNLLPYIGLTMPFVGGTGQTILIDYVLLGILLNISRFKIERAGD